MVGPDPCKDFHRSQPIPFTRRLYPPHAPTIQAGTPTPSDPKEAAAQLAKAAAIGAANGMYVRNDTNGRGGAYRV